MSFPYLLAVAALVSLPLGAQSAQKNIPPQPDPLDASVPVPAVSYVSALTNYRAPAELRETPDKAWKSANDEARRIGGHAGQMKSVASGQESPAKESTADSAAKSGAAAPDNHSKHH